MLIVLLKQCNIILEKFVHRFIFKNLDKIKLITFPLSNLAFSIIDGVDKFFTDCS